MVVNIEITKSGVLAEVSKTTAYEGAHSGAFDNTFAKPEDRDMLERYWNEGVAFITDAVKKFATKIVNNSTSYKAELFMPSNYDQNMTASVNQAAFDYLCNFIVGKWLEMLTSEKAGSYANAATAQLAEMRSLLLHRVAPKRPES